MSSPNNFQHFARLALGLAGYYALLDSTSPDSNWVGAVSGVLSIVLAFAADLDIHSVPGNELDRVYELQRHCISVEGLLAKPTVDALAIRQGCNEAIGQLCYLLELVSIPLATLVEAFCPITEEPAWATITPTFSNC